MSDILLSVIIGGIVSISLMVFSFLIAALLFEEPPKIKRFFFKLFRSKHICPDCYNGRIDLSYKDVSKDSWEIAIETTYVRCKKCRSTGFI